jgi:hypothetical protein
MTLATKPSESGGVGADAGRRERTGANRCEQVRLLHNGVVKLKNRKVDSVTT